MNQLEINSGSGGLDEIMQMLTYGTWELQRRRELRRWNNILQENNQRFINLRKGKQMKKH